MFDAANFTDAVLSGSQFDGTDTPFFHLYLFPDFIALGARPVLVCIIEPFY